MDFLDNVNNTVGEDLKKTVVKGSKVSIASAVFSIYAYQELKKQLNSVEEFDFIFTSPTFVKEKAPKERREFFIPQSFFRCFLRCYAVTCYVFGLCDCVGIISVFHVTLNIC